MLKLCAYDNVWCNNEPISYEFMSLMAKYGVIMNLFELDGFLSLSIIVQYSNSKFLSDILCTTQFYFTLIVVLKICKL